MNAIVYALILYGLITGQLEVLYAIIAVLCLKAFDIMVQIYNNQIIMWNSQFDEDDQGDDDDDEGGFV